MKSVNYALAIHLLLLGIANAFDALASNGYLPHGVGAKNKAMGGVGMALPEDAISVVNNPAVAALLNDRMDVGLAATKTNRNYTSLFPGSRGYNQAFTINPQNIDSDEDLFFSPEFAGTRNLTGTSAFGWAFYTRHAFGADYQGTTASFDPDADGPLGVMTLPGTFGDGQAGMELSQALMDLTWAKRWNEHTAFGLSAVLAAQSLKVKGVGGLAKYTKSFADSGGAQLPGNLTGNGRDVVYGAGLKLGVHQQFADRLAFGAMYQTRINMGSFSDYSDLFAGGGDLDIPAWFRAGLSWTQSASLTLSVDVQYIWYSDIDALGNRFRNIDACPTAGLGGTDTQQCLGGKNGAGYGWDDVMVYGFGARWLINQDWTLRAGLSFADQPTRSDEVTSNILMINLTEAHYCVGFSRRLGDNGELSVSLMYAEEESLESLNQLDPLQVVRLTADQFDLQFSYSWQR